MCRKFHVYCSLLQDNPVTVAKHLEEAMVPKTLEEGATRTPLGKFEVMRPVYRDYMLTGEFKLDEAIKVIVDAKLLRKSVPGEGSDGYYGSDINVQADAIRDFIVAEGTFKPVAGVSGGEVAVALLKHKDLL